MVTFFSFSPVTCNNATRHVGDTAVSVADINNIRIDGKTIMLQIVVSRCCCTSKSSGVKVVVIRDLKLFFFWGKTAHVVCCLSSTSCWYWMIAWIF